MKKRMKKGFAWVMTFAMLLSLLPATGLTALAATTATDVKYIDTNEVELTCASATVVEASDSRVTWTEGWYVVNSNVAIPKGVDVSGAVNLILADGASLTISGVDNKKAGICVTDPNSLTIYGQPGGTGKLTVTGGASGAGIGGGKCGSGSNITIIGGTVMANGGSGGAGIGGGSGGSGSNITINGGTVTANGGSGGAGIGGGSEGSGSSNIKIAAFLTVRAGNSANPTDVIENDGNDGEDLANKLNDKQYATVTPPVSYLSPEYNTSDTPTSGLQKMESKICASNAYTLVTASDVTWGTESQETWYVVNGTISIPNSVTCNGYVHLILKDGSSLTISNAGIRVSGESNSLTIYGQSGGTGKLTVTGGAGGAGIGGSEQSSGNNITINGGKITATGGSNNGAGIGGGGKGSGSNIIINSGEVTATGGSYAAGIGGGSNYNAGDISKGSGIIINGGKVNASSGMCGAGIGGGTGSSGETITITGGEVTANGSNGGAGIGGGSGGGGSAITITGGKVTATGGSDNGAGIGGGGGSKGSDIEITGGEVTATGGRYAAGIGGGSGCGGCSGIGSGIKITGGTVTANGGETGAGIGGGTGSSGETITITGGEVTATGGRYAAGIGGGNDGGGSAITITGGIVTANGDIGGAGIGGGHASKGENITITGGEVTATGGVNSAGIGGGSGNNVGSGIGSNITITGGIVTANGNNGGAGIGGGHDSRGEDITITGGEVTATGGMSGAAGVGNGIECKTAAIRIKVDTALTVKAGASANPTVVIGKNRASADDLADSLSGQQYATITLPYLSPVYKEDGKPISGLKEMETKNCADFTVVESTDTTWNSGWYVVSGEISIPNSVTCNGDVHLILKDGSKLTISNAGKAGIAVTAPNSLTIYGQSEGTGQLEVTGDLEGAGIGGNKFSSGNNITINGGKITAKGGNGNGAGIGGGAKGNGSDIIINSGEVTAIGGSWAAGIGGGSNYGDGNISQGSAIVINGGNVNATGGTNGAGIGGGNGSGGSAITINGGEVTANGCSEGAGIGGGIGGGGSAITITGGKVTANGGEGNGAGIGGGGNSAGSDITITGGEVTATGGSFAAGIGGGSGYGAHSGTGSNITITGGIVTARSGGDGAGIGGGHGSNGNNITITGGTVTATGGCSGVAGIGNGSGCNTAARGIKVNTALTVKADTMSPPATVIANVADKDLAADLAGKQYVMAKKTLTIANTTVAGKTYDGTTAATATAGTVSGFAEGDTVSVTATAAFTDANAGENKDVTVAYTLGGDDADKYFAPVDETLTATIGKRPVTLYSESATKTFDGTPLTAETVYADSDKTAVDTVFAGEVNTLKATGSVTYASEGDVKNIISYTFNEGKSEGNYDITKTEGTLTVTDVATCSYNIALKDNIAMNFFVKVPTGFNVENYKVKTTFNGTVTGPVSLSSGTKKTEDGLDIYKFTVSDIYSYQMTFPVKFELLYNNATIKTVEKSVRDYCTEQNSSTELVALCNAALQYGGDAQKYFKGKTYGTGTPYVVFPTSAEVYASDGITRVTPETKPTATTGVSGSIEGFSNFAASLLLGNETSLKFYFNYTGSNLGSYTFSCAGKTVEEPTYISGTQYSVTVPGIKACELGTSYTLTISDGSNSITIPYSAFAYAAAKWSDGDTKLVDLCKSLVNYGNKASEYFTAN